MNTQEHNEPTVRHDVEGRRFVIELDGEVVGKAEYRDQADQRIFFHTSVDKEQSGKGLAGTLVSEALDATVSDGRRIVAVCPYVARYVERHDTWAERVDPVTDAVKAFLRSALPGS